MRVICVIRPFIIYFHDLKATSSPLQFFFFFFLHISHLKFVILSSHPSLHFVMGVYQVSLVCERGFESGQIAAI